MTINEDPMERRQVAERALEAVRDASKCFQGGTAITAENLEQTRQETQAFYAAVEKAKELNLSPYSIQSAMGGRIYVSYL